MAKLFIREDTIIETGANGTEKDTPWEPCESCSEVQVGPLLLEADQDMQQCGGGEYVRATAWINAPDYQNLLIIPNASSFDDAVGKARICGGDPRTVSFHTPAIFACGPYIRCNS